MTKPPTQRDREARREAKGRSFTTAMAAPVEPRRKRRHSSLGHVKAFRSLRNPVSDS